MHIAGAILCLLIAAVLASVLVEDWYGTPGWVDALAAFATLVMLVSAARVYAWGARRKQIAEGPRTRIVIAQVPAEPPIPSAERQNADD